MTNFQLSSFLTISGIGATSGLIYINNSLFIISDSSTFLYQYTIENKQLNKIKLLENAQENIIKKDKLDFEALTQKGDKLYLFGSGSIPKREKRFSYNLKTKAIKEKSLTKLYRSLKDFASISNDDLNIEGAFFNNKNLYLFQRGNGENSQNGIFIIDENKNVNFTKINLPKIKNIEATFTDAILVEDNIYFLAAVENTTSTYLDGEVLGSFVGCLSLNDLELKFCTKISETHKFEGITLFNKTNSEIIFLLCKDNDTEILETEIYKLTLN